MSCQVIIENHCKFQSFVINGPITGNTRAIATVGGLITEGKYSSYFSVFKIMIWLLIISYINPAKKKYFLGKLYKQLKMMQVELLVTAPSIPSRWAHLATELLQSFAEQTQGNTVSDQRAFMVNLFIMNCGLLAFPY